MIMDPIPRKPTNKITFESWGWVMKLQPLGVTSACGFLALSVFVGFLLVGCAAYDRFGVAGVETAGIAAGVCWFAATTALLVTSWQRNSPHAVAGILVADGLRFGLPFVIGITLQFSHE